MNTHSIQDPANVNTIHRLKRRGSYERTVSDLFASGGITLNGAQPYDPHIHTSRFYKRVLRQGSLGLGESYMDGWWDCTAIDEMISRLLQADVHETVKPDPFLWLKILRARLFNLQSVRRAYQVADAHYNLGNNLFIGMLGKTMCYSCAYWKNVTDLDQAQINKLDLSCRKLDLQAGEHVLDIGCGWGSFARYATEHYGVRVTGITVSKEQRAWAVEHCRGLPVDIHLQDYRKLEGRFDKLVSIGMFEHVGVRNYKAYFGAANRVLKEGGLFVLHTIGTDRSFLDSDPWINRYIFPNGKIPSLRQLAAACEQHFIIEDVQNFGPDYDTTLMAWKDRFEAAWPELRSGYDERFRRMWRYYLACCAGSFRSAQMQIFQLVLRRRNQPRRRYDAPR